MSTAFQHAYNYNCILTMNRDVVCSLRNRAFPLSCVIDSTLIQWHRVRERIGSEPDTEQVCSSHRFYFKRRGHAPAKTCPCEDTPLSRHAPAKARPC